MATVIDSLLVTFGFDTSGLTAGAASAQSSLGSIRPSAAVAEDGIKAVGDKSDETGSKLGSLAKFASAGIAALAGFVALKSIAQNFLSSADAIGKFSNALGLNVEDVGSWGDAVSRSGGSLEGFQGSLKSLSEKLTDISIRGNSRALPFFEALGINVHDANGQVKGALPLMEELSSAVEGMGKQESFAILKKIGLDEGTIMFLQQGKNAIKEQTAAQKELGAYTAEQSQIAAKFNDSFDDLKKVISFAVSSIVGLLIPALTKITEYSTRFVVFLRNNSEIVHGFFATIAAVIAALVLPSIYAIGKAILGSLLPILPLIAIITAIGLAIGLLVEDFIIWQEGGESAIGAIIDWFGTMKVKVIEVWGGLKKVIGDFWMDVKNIAGEAIDWVMGKIDSLLSGVKSVTGAASRIGEGIGSFFGVGAASAAVTSGNKTSNVTETTNVSGITINVPSGDPKIIAEGLGGAIKDNARRVRNSDSGNAL